ncbi:MAG: dihydrodipicolinate synthase family protein [Spirochaetia bacterium]|jgi:4-hydroxy-tetrahydrodipicolinate synthase|nr:dihydrodipicolinate synthase family protein [Spirochaetia bacterium]
MKHETIADGVWPTMITPYTEDGSIDYGTLEKMVDWFVDRGVAGLFAVCQSSEMFFLSLRERLELARACVRFAKGRIPVIASGLIADDLYDQIEEAGMMADTGVEAVVLLTNRFARADQGDEVFKRNLERFLSALSDDILLGFYECPAPYKRLVSPEIMKFAVETGRFGFLKDTSCSMAGIKEKLRIAKGSNFKLFNANAATLLDSLKAGCAGYSGVMTNFHPDLYSWICDHWKDQPELAAELQDFIGLASVIEYQLYPVNAMYALSLEGLPFRLSSRRADASRFNESMRREVEQLLALSHRYAARCSKVPGA